MKIILDKNTKEGILVKNDGTEISKYSFKNLINKDFTFEQFESDIESFNKTLAMQEEFDNIKDLRKIVNLHNW